MSFHPVDPALVQSLGGQQQVDAEAAPHSLDHHEQLDEVRLGRQQFEELVDHDHQRRSGASRAPARRAFS
ncbi:hypothetical protein PQR15_08195 [Streptomyces lydicus]|nr:hypothetical protein [Streptomyces lydicus]